MITSIFHINLYLSIVLFWVRYFSTFSDFCYFPFLDMICVTYILICFRFCQCLVNTKLLAKMHFLTLFSRYSSTIIYFHSFSESLNLCAVTEALRKFRCPLFFTFLQNIYLDSIYVINCYGESVGDKHTRWYNFIIIFMYYGVEKRHRHVSLG